MGCQGCAGCILEEKLHARACLKNHSCNLHAPFCGTFVPNSVVVAHYGALIRAKSPTNCDAHLAESLFQTRSRPAIQKRSSSEKELLLLHSLLLGKSTLADSACWTDISASSALHAGICIDYVMLISLRNSACRTLALAGSAAYALVRNYICHCYILL